MNNSINFFNKYIFICIFILVGIPIFGLFVSDHKFSVARIFESISIPIFLSVYSIFWIIFTRQIDNYKRKLPILEERLKSINGKHEFFNEIKILDNTILETKIKIGNTELYLKHINETLRVGVVIGAIFKIIIFLTQQ